MSKSWVVHYSFSLSCYFLLCLCCTLLSISSFILSSGVVLSCLFFFDLYSFPKWNMDVFRMTAMQLKTTATVLLRDQTKKKREGGLCGGFKEPPCFQDLDWTGSAELAGYLARPTDPQKTQRRETCRSYLSIATLPLQRDRDKTRDQKKQTSVHFFMRYGTYTSTVNWEESRYALWALKYFQLPCTDLSASQC